MEWRKKWHYSEMERQRLNVIVTERENELAGKDHQVLGHFVLDQCSLKEFFLGVNNLQRLPNSRKAPSHI
jgi:hypothetical protein